MPKRTVVVALSTLACLFGAINSRAEVAVADGTQAPTGAPTALHVFKKGLDAPGDMVLSGKELFVSNVFGGFKGDGSVTELNIATGAVVRIISAAAYRFSGPNSLALWGGQLFAANAGADAAGSVTEFNVSTGKLVRVISGPSYGFQGPSAIVPDGQRLFVLNSGSYDTPGSVTELDASTGAVVRVISGREYKFSVPDGMVLNRGNLLVSDSNEGKGGWLTEISASTGKLERVISGPAYHFVGPGPMAADGTEVFVLNRSGSSVTEINASTGKLVRVISNLAYHGEALTALAISGSAVYVAGGLGTVGPRRCFVKEVMVSSGSLVDTISGASYDFVDPEAILPDVGYLLVLDSGSNSITEFPEPR